MDLLFAQLANRAARGRKGHKTDPASFSVLRMRVILNISSPHTNGHHRGYDEIDTRTGHAHFWRARQEPQRWLENGIGPRRTGCCLHARSGAGGG
jgi:hypothetical protein